ncbi:RecQ family ATP-dependent DNA helicase [Colletotrichum higginsianum IMI 349063]|uniref:RecQ family ATP-dependent DNA helicase n=1 Tax=Colletotrichum higginsianum (strain IMI 349063) TaxID=759273 RepID=A0A1B7YU94_COLHI|nr:RecQ family ATP-dependent DNA helicase [Colletotrichum higginsianum IMI 349063]OBR15593.1 RecQ family ATP-dependent DNA helicase [Colletotrichum higginsianum IMI 349063]
MWSYFVFEIFRNCPSQTQRRQYLVIGSKSISITHLRILSSSKDQRTKIGDLNRLTDLNKQLTGKKRPGQHQHQPQQQQELCQTAGSKQEWANIGSETKRAIADYQADQAAGKSPGYTKIGGVVETAFSAYNGGGDDSIRIGKKGGLADIGKEISAGFNI